MTIHFAGLALIMFGAGIAAFVVGGLLSMTFDISDWLPPIGAVLAVCGVVCAALAVGIQVGAWIGVS